MERSTPIVIVGSGVFGIGAALELSKRGYKDVTVVDEYVRDGKTGKGKAHPAASSYDISKVVRSDYGKNEIYTRMNDEAIQQWKQLNKKWGEDLYHETGLVVALTEEIKPGTYPHDSLTTLRKMNYPVIELNEDTMKKKFPKLAHNFKHGYYNPRAGWVESGRALEKFISEAELTDIKFINGKVKEILYCDGGKKVKGLKLYSGKEILSDYVIVAAGSWTPLVVPHLKDFFVSNAQPVMHFKINDPKLVEQFSAPNFPVFFADPVNLGFYGFPIHPKEGVLKIAIHSKGYPLQKGKYFDKDFLENMMKSEVFPIEEKRFRAFIEKYLPEIKEATCVYTRLCMYCDSVDGNFLIDHDPNIKGLFIASGGSGHGLKFAPVIGSIIADAFEKKENPYKKLFEWRSSANPEFDVARFIDKEAQVISKL